MQRSRLATTLERMSRFGYVAKGVTYGLVGVLALRAALDGGGQVSGSKGALALLVGEGALGRVLLAVLGFGLASYAIWQFSRAIFDPEQEGGDVSGLLKRGFFGISGLLLASLATYAINLAIHGIRSPGSGRQGLVARALDWPAGQWVVGVFGAGIAGYGLRQIWRGWSSDFREKLDLSRLDQTATTWAVCTSRFGYVARGVVFCLVGWLFVRAAMANSSIHAGGLSEALRRLGAAGPWVLGLVAIGLIAFGFASVIRGLFRKIRIDSEALPG